MIWLIIGVLGILGFLTLLILGPVWAGMGSVWESLLIFGICVVITAAVAFFALAIEHGASQVFG